MIQKFRFQTRIGDINYGGHMGNDKFLLLFHDARLQFLKQFGFSEINIGENTSLIMTEAYVSFKGEVFLGDEIEIEVKIGEMQKIRFKMEYSAKRVSDAKLVATGFTTLAAFDYGSRKICKIPEIFINTIGLE